MLEEPFKSGEKLLCPFLAAETLLCSWGKLRIRKVPQGSGPRVLQPAARGLERMTAETAGILFTSSLSLSSSYHSRGQFRSVVLRFGCTVEPPGELYKLLIPGSHSQKFYLIILWSVVDIRSF